MFQWQRRLWHGRFARVWRLAPDRQRRNDIDGRNDPSGGSTGTGGTPSTGGSTGTGGVAATGGTTGSGGFDGHRRRCRRQMRAGAGGPPGAVVRAAVGAVGGARREGRAARRTAPATRSPSMRTSRAAMTRRRPPCSSTSTAAPTCRPGNANRTIEFWAYVPTTALGRPTRTRCSSTDQHQRPEHDGFGLDFGQQPRAALAPSIRSRTTTPLIR